MTEVIENTDGDKIIITDPEDAKKSNTIKISGGPSPMDMMMGGPPPGLIAAMMQEMMGGGLPPGMDLGGPGVVKK